MEEKEKLLLDAWIKLFWNYWVKKTSIDEIAKEAWVGKGTFYLYFKNKEDLYKRIIDSNFEYARKGMQDLFDRFPEIEERLVNYLVGSIFYFKKNDIIRNMVLGEQNYYIWNINIKYLEQWYMEMLDILLKDLDKKYLEKIDFLAKLMWNFKQVLLLEWKCLKTEKEFDEFILDYAKVLVNWFFSDYNKIAENLNLDMIKKMV